MSSIAVSLDRISRVVGYIIKKGTFNVDSPNLPQRIAILAEANEAYQATLLTTPQQITSAQQAASLFGPGSPIHMIARIILPIFGDGVGGIPVIVYPQARAAGAASKLLKIVPTGVATSNVTHYVKIAGRTGVDGTFYAVNILAGDNSAQVAQKIEDAVNAVYGSPVVADADAYETILTSKWKGLTADGLSVSIDTNGNAAGMSYAVSSPQAGSGTPSIAAALAQFGTDWNTIVVNSYGLETTTIQTLMAYNGIPGADAPTGRYSGIIMKPFIAITGSVADDPSATTDAYLNDVTIAVAPAPGSPALALEAAANMTLLYAVQAQNSPHLDVSGQSYPDMPISTTWASASMAVYNTRDAIVKKGCSTVNIVAGAYQVQDFVTTYHPAGEVPPQFRYCRNLNIDMNVRYGYYLLEIQNVVDHVIANDSDTVTADKVVKPKTWKAVIDQYADDLSQRALIVDAPFMANSITVSIGTTNPDRFETFFRYKRSGFARIASTTAEAGFNFGTLN
jgi:phage tail sheath gpL-like